MLYCLCHKGSHLKTQPNGSVPNAPVEVYLGEHFMRCIQIGAEQFLKDDSKHYPNVDVYQCDKCGVRVAKE